MLVGIVGDIHLGISENKPEFVEYQKNCLLHAFSSFKELGIEHVIYLGDIFDKRQSISIKTLRMADELFDNDFFQYFVVGNHDTAYKNSNELNSVDILLGKKNKVFVTDPEEVEIGSKKFLFVPWINKNNSEESTKIIKKSKADYMMAHLDLVGFEMLRGIVSRNGHVSMSDLENFTHVISGHYHCCSEKKNVTYLGNVCQMNWADYNESKHVGYINTEDDSLNLIEMPINIYEKIRINSEDDCINPLLFKGKIVKCYLYTDRNVKIEKFLTELIEVAASVNIIDEKVNVSVDGAEFENQNLSILDLWEKYMQELELTKSDVKAVTKIFHDTYTKVMSEGI
jgi:DNA repair exonuclease SbcCD nuclease subunit